MSDSFLLCPKFFGAITCALAEHTESGRDQNEKKNKRLNIYCYLMAITGIPTKLDDRSNIYLKTLDKPRTFFYNDKAMEKYPSGSRGSPAKGVVR